MGGSGEASPNRPDAPDAEHLMRREFAKLAVEWDLAMSLDEAQALIEAALRSAPSPALEDGSCPPS